jgi:hypothetical protein
MRVYLPATLPTLTRWIAAGRSSPGPGHAVTPTLRESYREGDEEEMEYIAQLDAARSALDLLADDVDAPRRRVVLAADVPDLDVAVEPDGANRSAVTVGTPVPMSSWASALVDDEDSEAVVSAAVTALGAAAAGDDDAAFLIDEAGATELGWYGIQELRHLFPPE